MTTAIRTTLAEVRTYVAARPLEFRVAYLAAFVVGASLIVTPMTLWAWVLFADTVAAAMGLGAWCVVLRTRLAAANDYATEAQAVAARAVDQAETFADEIKAVCAANEILCAELAYADQQIRRLSGDLLAAQMLASDATAELANAPAPVVPLRSVPPQRDGSEYEWPRLARQIEHDDLTALMRATEEK